MWLAARFIRVPIWLDKSLPAAGGLGWGTREAAGKEETNDLGALCLIQSWWDFWVCACDSTSQVVDLDIRLAAFEKSKSNQIPNWTRQNNFHTTAACVLPSNIKVHNTKTWDVPSSLFWLWLDMIHISSWFNPADNAPTKRIIHALFVY